MTHAGVISVLPEKRYELDTTRTPYFLGLDVHNACLFPETTGASNDIVVGVFDTGVWPESKSFTDEGYGPIPPTWKGGCDTGTNFTASLCNRKLVGARFFARAGSVVQGASLLGFANGIASRALVAVYKVCWINGGCLSSDILAQNYTGASLFKGDALLPKLLSFVYAGNASNNDTGNLWEVVKAAGGLGMILANTEDDGEELQAVAYLLPAATVGQKAGDVIRNYVLTDPNPAAMIVIQGTVFNVQPSPVLAAFSSRGPNPVTPNILKPDLIAPGVNILAGCSAGLKWNGRTQSKILEGP
ncbi:hypothetical protein F2Q69_00059892 [Brassica cretica]|uniref:PRELI/MSF1 domain-containing protein n=1 Tax=Brassica cretica TaxID=69181 RepID=A0A8S9RAX6_BRACR|nr:hypothetical protein F2Q69_00059892 [Brassica cretica]